MSSAAAKPTAPSRGLLQSLVIKAQRQTLDEIGRAVGTDVVYLKAAWADPVLYGGRGERTGTDVDVLVRPQAFWPFAEALEARGFRLIDVGPEDRAADHVATAGTFEAPPGQMAVDLHRNLTYAPWFELDSDAMIDRAIAYPSIDGPILSLSPEDQIVYAAAHQANHGFAFHEKQIDDVVALLRMRPIDWDVVVSRAGTAHLRLALAMVGDGLVARGVSLPSGLVLSDRWGGLRRLALRRLVEPVRTVIGRRFPLHDLNNVPLPYSAQHYLLVLPLLSDRLLALPVFLAAQFRRQGLRALARIGGRR